MATKIIEWSIRRRTLWARSRQRNLWYVALTPNRPMVAAPYSEAGTRAPGENTMRIGHRATAARHAATCDQPLKRGLGWRCSAYVLTR